MSNQDSINQYFNDLQARIQAATALVIPILANDTVNYALENFEKESFEGKKWAPRKDKKNTRKLLVKTGRLKRSITVTSIKPSGYSVGSDVPYAAVHNYGLEISKAQMSETFVRNRYTKGPKAKYFGGMGAFKKGTKPGQGYTKKAYKFNMTKRQYLGATPILAARLIKLAKTEILKALKG